MIFTECYLSWSIKPGNRCNLSTYFVSTYLCKVKTFKFDKKLSDSIKAKSLFGKPNIGLMNILIILIYETCNVIICMQGYTWNFLTFHI